MSTIAQQTSRNANFAVLAEYLRSFVLGTDACYVPSQPVRR